MFFKNRPHKEELEERGILKQDPKSLSGEPQDNQTSKGSEELTTKRPEDVRRQNLEMFFQGRERDKNDFLKNKPHLVNTGSAALSVFLFCCH